MRRILSAREYERLWSDLSADEMQKAAEAVAGAACELMEQFRLYRAVFLCRSPLHPLAVCASQLLQRAGRDIEVALLPQEALPALTHCLVCDLLFSASADDASASTAGNWLSAIAAADSPILSVGIPAGVDPDSGRAWGSALQAKITVAPFAYLSGLFLHDGLDHCGAIRPVGGETETGDRLFRFEEADATRLLPPRKRTAHKGDSGKALLCVGSPKYVGAALLSARACLAAGCGILFVACPDVVRGALITLPEAIGIPVGPDWDAESCQRAGRAFEGMKAAGLGCGVGSGDFSSLIEIALRSKLPLVLDADGLNCLSRHPELYRLLHDKVALTPHPGEMGRLTGLSLDEVQDDPVGLAIRYASRWGCTVLLKGAATVVSDGKRTCIVAEGNAGLGKGGSGDVLTGIVTGLLAQGVGTYEAACLGSYLLGTSAQKAFMLLKERMLRASNVIEALEDLNT